MYKIPAKTVFLGKNLVFVPECHSTNALAHELGQNTPIVEGTVIVTSNQTAGRGQRGNSWDSEAGKNLTFSVIVKPRFLAVRDQFFLNIITCLAVRDVVSDKLSAQASVKWPNDILIEQKKLCGILIENQIQGQQVSSSVIGIGINVNQQHFDLATATSLSRQTRKQFDLPSLFEEALGRLESRYLQLRAGQLDVLREEYLKHLYWKNEIHTFASMQGQFQGRITGIDASGRLTVSVANEEKTFQIQELRYLE
ncbi:MAG TPA: biotin--[acetyl-CoA-carboxylase] ligase [Chryseosolibacter sp.]|nr:biotin--[acetyl-CoA-carboxylase] ligase [Chryseosolibacter sp.]